MGSDLVPAYSSRQLPQTALMAAIVTTLLCVPVWGLLALASFGVLDVSFQAFLTFGGALNAVQGLLAWWTLGYVPAFLYAVAMDAQR
jgi:hypothetical protein